jgi:DNA-binding transcriptional regulator YbjK
MAVSGRGHRASAQRRRDALLRAAAELAAELGAGAVTHRAVAARAGVPLSTTSYFFSSIDELVTEALLAGAAERVADFDAAERAAVATMDRPITAVIDAAVDGVLAASRTTEGDLIELYLASGRQPELREETTASAIRSARRIGQHLAQYEAERPDEVSWAIKAFIDGATLHRVAELDIDHREQITTGMRLLVAAAMLTDCEVDALLARYDEHAGVVCDEARATAASASPVTEPTEPADGEVQPAR